MASRYRVRILCEDRRSERFLRGLCKRFGVRILHVEVAPDSKGSASDWVLAKYAEAVGKRRSKNVQTTLGLLVHIDGDKHGFQARKAQMDDRLQRENLPLRGSSEPNGVPPQPKNVRKSWG